MERGLIDYVVRRVDGKETNHSTRSRERPRKTIRENIKKDLEII